MPTPAQLDPTGTLTLRKRFVTEMNKRFGEIVSVIRETIVQNDALDLKANVAEAARRKAFQFERDPRKVDAFMAWLRKQQEKGILEVTTGPSGGTEPWSNLYVRKAYQKGLDDAIRRMENQGIIEEDGVRFDPETAWRSPFHADRLEMLYTRTFSDLKGVTEAMDTQISRVLIEGMSAGDNPLKMASKINDRVKKVGRHRARILARTEVVRSHAESSLNAYEQFGVRGVSVDAEWSTAGDDRVCPLCAPLGGVVMSVKEARGLLPRHPQCRCAWIPSDPGDRRKKSKTGTAAEKAWRISEKREGTTAGAVQ